jgi:hypothetical protein
MNRTIFALHAAFDAMVAVAIGIGISLVPLSLVWAFHYGAALDWLIFWRASADIWLLGNGVGFTAVIDPTTAAALGVAGADQPFAVTLAPLAVALISVFLGVRVGRRAATGSFPVIGVVVPIATYAVLSIAVTVMAMHPAFAPLLWAGCVMPPIIFGLGVIGGYFAGAGAGAGAFRAWLGRLGELWPPVRHGIEMLPRGVRAVTATALVTGTAATAGVILFASVLVAVLIVITYAASIGLYESLQAGVLGGAVVTLVQLAYLPDVVIWAASWLVGPGFSIGTASSVSPVGTQLGPMPSLPLLSILPRDVVPLGFLGIAVPLLGGFVAATLTRSRLVGSLGEEKNTVGLLAAGVATGLVCGLIIGFLAWCASGAAGPGRLVSVGPDPVLVGAVAAGEVAVGAIVGFIARVRR